MRRHRIVRSDGPVFSAQGAPASECGQPLLNIKLFVFMSAFKSKDFWSGILFVLTGIFFIVFAQEHELGSASRMGPAYFPTLLAGIMSFLGAFIALRAVLTKKRTEDDAVEPFRWRILVLVLGSVFIFTMLLAWCGLMISLAAMVAVAALADPASRVKETVILIAVLDLLAYVIFVYGIGLIVPVWPSLAGPGL